MTDGILDLLTMILVLAIVLAVGFSLVLPLMNTDLMQYEESITDKSMLTAVKDGSDSDIAAVTGDYSKVPKKDVMSAREVVLMTQVQDVCMPLPRKFRVNGNVLEVSSTYKLTMRSTGMAIWGVLPNQSSSAYYTVDFGYGIGSIEGDDAFDIVLQ